MATVTIKELYDLLTVDNILQYDYSIKASDIDNNIQTIISSGDTISYILRKYGTRRYSILKGAEVNNSEAQLDLNEAFRLWILNRQHNIDKQYQALFNYDYSPIENVDRYESEKTNTDNTTTYGKSTSHSGTDTESHTGTDTTTYNNKSTNTETKKDAHTGEDINTHSIAEDVNKSEKAGFNAPNTYANDTKNTHTLNGEVTKVEYDSVNAIDGENVTEDASENKLLHGESISNQYGEKITDSGNDTLNGVVNRELRVHGNIGVTTNTQLLHDEIDLRMLSLAEMLIDNFINDYTFYS